MAARLVDAQAPAAAGAVRRLGGVVGVGPALGRPAARRAGPAAAAGRRARPARRAAGGAGRDRPHPDRLPGRRPTRCWPARRSATAGRCSARSTRRRAADHPAHLAARRRSPGGSRWCWRSPPAGPGAAGRPGARHRARRRPVLLPGRRSRCARCVGPSGTSTGSADGPRPARVGVRAALAGWSAARRRRAVVRARCRCCSPTWCPPTTGHLVDAAGDALPLRPGTTSPWWLLAAAGGRPVTVAGEYGPAGFRPLAAWPDGRYVPAPPRAGGDRRGRRSCRRTCSRPRWSAPSAGRSPPGRSSSASAVLPAVPGGDPAAGLLEAAAVALTYRRAGVTPRPAG